MAIFTILYGNYYPPHGEFKLICMGKFSRRAWVNFTQQYGKNRQRCEQNNFTMLYGNYCYIFIENFPPKFSPCIETFSIFFTLLNFFFKSWKTNVMFRILDIQSWLFSWQLMPDLWFYGILNFFKNGLDSSNFHKIRAIVLKLHTNMLYPSKNFGIELDRNWLKPSIFFRFWFFENFLKIVLLRQISIYRAEILCVNALTLSGVR